MDQAAIKQLLEKYRTGMASEQEQQLLDNWYALELGHQLQSPELEDYVRIKKEMWAVLAPAPTITAPVKLWPKIAVAAAAVAAITLGMWLYYSSSRFTTPSSRSAERNLYTNDIGPGKNTATLTLANGKTILLDTNKTSVVVADSVQTMTMLTASTPRGGTYQVILPDRTKVWLNADSKISFPSQFNGKERKILLEGEAYFEVAKVQSSSLSSAATKDLIPFIVETKRQTIEVLGTHFNVAAYAEEQKVMTTLLEGKVKVTGDGNTLTLAPGEQAFSGLDGIRGLKTDDPASVIDWKNGEFTFESQTIEQVMHMVARWYNVEVIYEGPKPVKKFSGGVSRFDNLSKLLRILEGTGGAHFRIEERKIYVSD